MRPTWARLEWGARMAKRRENARLQRSLEMMEGGRLTRPPA